MPLTPEQQAIFENYKRGLNNSSIYNLLTTGKSYTPEQEQAAFESLPQEKQKEVLLARAAKKEADRKPAAIVAEKQPEKPSKPVKEKEAIKPKEPVDHFKNILLNTLSKSDRLEITPEELEGKAVLLDQAQQQKNAIDSIQQYINTIKNQKQQIDLSPLLALTDSVTGSRLLAGYRRPTSREEKDAQVITLQKYLAGLSKDATDTQLKIMNFEPDLIDKKKKRLFDELSKQAYATQVITSREGKVKKIDKRKGVLTAKGLSSLATEIEDIHYDDLQKIVDEQNQDRVASGKKLIDTRKVASDIAEESAETGKSPSTIIAEYFEG